MSIDAAALSTHTGSSTLVVTALDKLNPILYTSLIGDSGYYIFRRMNNTIQVVYKSDE